MIQGCVAPVVRSRPYDVRLGETRLSVHRTPRHIYAQVIAPAGDKVLASASTLR